MSNLTITKGKLLKGDRVEIQYLKNNGIESKPAECSEIHKSPPHIDLKKAFDSLIIHSCLVGEFIPLQAIKDINNPDPEQVKDFTVTGFTVVGEDLDEGVILSARKTLKSGKTLGYNCPKILFNSETETTYDFADDLALCIAGCRDELQLYLGGKFAPDPQGVLFMDENKEVIHGEAKVKRGRKKVNEFV